MFNEAKKLIDKSNNIYVVGHIGPDGDSIGAAFGMCLALRKMGKNANVIMQQCSDSFKFLPYINEAKKNVEEESYDLLVCVDSSSNDRLDMLKEDYDKAKSILMIDHHKKVNPYGDVNCIVEDLPAASEIVYDLLRAMEIEIDKDIGTYIYTGIMTDTGSFNYASTKPSTLIAAAYLVEIGVDFGSICDKLNHTLKEPKLKLIAKAIDNMEVYYGGKLRYSYVSYEDINRLGVEEEDAEGMTNYLRMPEGTEISVYVRGKSDGTNKVSMRSGGNVDVSKIAIHFGGGGHVRAAGYTMRDDLEIEKQKLIEIIGGRV